MSSAPLVVVFGASGNQGGSVIAHLQKSKKSYRIRAVTRDPSKPASRALSDKGVEVVAGDLGDKGSVEAAVKGADIVFGVTNFWTHMSLETEVKEGKSLVDASKAAGVKLFVWSGLEDVTKVSKGKYTHVLHFDGKAHVTEYAQAQGVPTLVVEPGCYASNFTGMWAPRRQEDGTWVLALPCSPDTPISVIDIERDYGAYVVQGIEEPAFGAGKEVLAASEDVTVSEIARLIGAANGKEVKFVQLPEDIFHQNVPAPVGQEILEMLLFFQDYGYFGGKGLGPSNAHLAQPAHKFADYVKGADWSQVFTA